MGKFLRIAGTLIRGKEGEKLSYSKYIDKFFLFLFKQYYNYQRSPTEWDDFRFRVSIPQ